MSHLPTARQFWFALAVLIGIATLAFFGATLEDGFYELPRQADEVRLRSLVAKACSWLLAALGFPLARVASVAGGGVTLTLIAALFNLALWAFALRWIWNAVQASRSTANAGAV